MARTRTPSKTLWDRWSVRIAVICLVLAAVGTGVYAQAAGPGYAPWQDKASTLLRGIGLGPALDIYENWLYTRHAPANAAPDLTALGLIAVGQSGRPDYPGLPPLAATADGSGWRPVPRLPGTVPAVYTAVLQPDPRHRSVVVAVALLRSAMVIGHLMAGTEQPPGVASTGQIPPASLPKLVAAFNSGFKMDAKPGGFYADGATVRDLVPGKASAVIDDQGHLTIGEWGSDIRMSSHIVAVRQNLALIVKQGHPVPGLDRNTDLRWGSAHNQLQYTWRSALGVTRLGDLVYLAGDKLNLATLGAALVQAGAVTGMELDIHSGLEFFSAWHSDGTGPPQPHRLMQSMVGPADRYARPDSRDFFYFTSAGTADSVAK